MKEIYKYRKYIYIQKTLIWDFQSYFLINSKHKPTTKHIIETIENVCLYKTFFENNNEKNLFNAYIKVWNILK